VVWIDLDQLNVNPGAPVLTLDPDDMELSGNITTKFQPVAKALF
jgi:choloylglycine hydrolase